MGTLEEKALKLRETALRKSEDINPSIRQATQEVDKAYSLAYSEIGAAQNVLGMQRAINANQYNKYATPDLSGFTADSMFSKRNFGVSSKLKDLKQAIERNIAADEFEQNRALRDAQLGLQQLRLSNNALELGMKRDAAIAKRGKEIFESKIKQLALQEQENFNNQQQTMSDLFAGSGKPYDFSMGANVKSNIAEWGANALGFMANTVNTANNVIETGIEGGIEKLKGNDVDWDALYRSKQQDDLDVFRNPISAGILKGAEEEARKYKKGLNAKDLDTWDNLKDMFLGEDWDVSGATGLIGRQIVKSALLNPEMWAMANPWTATMNVGGKMYDYGANRQAEMQGETEPDYSGFVDNKYLNETAPSAIASTALDKLELKGLLGGATRTFGGTRAMSDDVAQAFRRIGSAENSIAQTGREILGGTQKFAREALGRGAIGAIGEGPIEAAQTYLELSASHPNMSEAEKIKHSKEAGYMGALVGGGMGIGTKFTAPVAQAGRDVYESGRDRYNTAKGQATENGFLRYMSNIANKVANENRTSTERIQTAYDTLQTASTLNVSELNPDLVSDIADALSVVGEQSKFHNLPPEVQQTIRSIPSELRSLINNQDEANTEHILERLNLLGSVGNSILKSLLTRPENIVSLLKGEGQLNSPDNEAMRGLERRYNNLVTLVNTLAENSHAFSAEEAEAIKIFASEAKDALSKGQNPMEATQNSLFFNSEETGGGRASGATYLSVGLDNNIDEQTTKTYKSKLDKFSVSHTNKQKALETALATIDNAKAFPEGIPDLSVVISKYEPNAIPKIVSGSIDPSSSEAKGMHVIRFKKGNSNQKAALTKMLANVAKENTVLGSLGKLYEYKLSKNKSKATQQPVKPKPVETENEKYMAEEFRPNRARIVYTRSGKADDAVKEANEGKGLYTMRIRGNVKIKSPIGILDSNHNFGNPFVIEAVAKKYNLKVPKQLLGKDGKEVSQRFKDWLLGKADRDIEPERREWILEQIYSGKLDNTDLIYYKEAERNNHAKVIEELINTKPEIEEATDEEIDTVDNTAQQAEKKTKNIPSKDAKITDFTYKIPSNGYGFRGEYFFLSNKFGENPYDKKAKGIKLRFGENNEYISTEQAYQNLKNNYKKAEKDIDKLSYPDGDTTLDLMYGLVKAKFEQHPELAEKLLAIEGNIIEKTPKDSFWGMVWNEKTNRYEGKNYLGKILDRVKKELSTSQISSKQASVKERDNKPRLIQASPANKTKENNKPVIQGNSKVILLDENKKVTLDDISLDSKNVYIIPTTTSQTTNEKVPNALGIGIKNKDGKPLSDEDFTEFKDQVDETLQKALELAKELGGDIKVIPNIGLGLSAKLDENAPRLYEYLTEKLDDSISRREGVLAYDVYRNVLDIDSQASFGNNVKDSHLKRLINLKDKLKASIRVPAFLQNPIDATQEILKTHFDHKVLSGMDTALKSKVGMNHKVEVRKGGNGEIVRHANMLAFLQDPMARAAMTYRGLEWLVTSRIGEEQEYSVVRENLETLFNVDNIPSKVVKELNGAVFLRNELEPLGRMLLRDMGIEINEKTTTEREASLLAQELGVYTLRALEHMGYIEKNSIKRNQIGPEGGDEQLVYYKVTKDKKGKPKYIQEVFYGEDTSKIYETLSSVATSMGIEDNAASYSFTPQTNFRNGKTKIKDRLDQARLPKAYKDAFDSMLNRPYSFFDIGFIKSLLSDENIKAIKEAMGYKEFQTNNPNKDDYVLPSEVKGAESKNKTVDKAVDDVVSFLNSPNAAKELFFNAKLSGDSRLFIQSVSLNPQTEKFVRFLLLSKGNESTHQINKNGELDDNIFYQSIAQAFGYSTDKKSLEGAVNLAKDIIDTVSYKDGSGIDRAKVTQALKGKLSDNNGNTLDISNEHPGHIINALNAIDNYLKARSNGEKEFTSHLVSEIDGVNNGLALKMLHYMIDPKYLDSLESAGVSFGKRDNTAPNERYADKSLEDLYKKFARDLGNRFNTKGFGEFDEKFAESLDQGTLDEVEEIKRLAEKSIQESIALDENQMVTSAARTLVKNPVTISGYGAAIYSASKKLASDLIDSMPRKALQYMKDVKANKETDPKNKEAYEVLKKALGAENYKQVFEALSSEEGALEYMSILNGYSVRDLLSKAIVTSIQPAMEKTFEEIFPNMGKVNQLINSVFNARIELINHLIENKIKRLLKKVDKELTLEELRVIRQKVGKEVSLPGIKFSIVGETDGFMPIHSVSSKTSMDDKDSIKLGLRKIDKENELENLLLRANTKSYGDSGASGNVIIIHMADGTAMAVTINKSKDYTFTPIHDAILVSNEQAAKTNKLYNEVAYEDAMNSKVMDSLAKMAEDTFKHQGTDFNPSGDVLKRADVESLEDMAKEMRKYATVSKWNRTILKHANVSYSNLQNGYNEGVYRKDDGELKQIPSIEGIKQLLTFSNSSEALNRSYDAIKRGYPKAATLLKELEGIMEEQSIEVEETDPTREKIFQEGRKIWKEEHKKKNTTAEMVMNYVDKLLKDKGLKEGSKGYNEAKEPMLQYVKELFAELGIVQATDNVDKELGLIELAKLNNTMETRRMIDRLNSPDNNEETTTLGEPLIENFTGELSQIDEVFDKMDELDSLDGRNDLDHSKQVRETVKDIFKANTANLKDLKVFMETKENHINNAHFDTRQNTISMRLGKEVSQARMSKAETFGHEMIHAMTYFGLKSLGLHSRAGLQLKSIHDQVFKHLKVEDFMPKVSTGNLDEDMKIAKKYFDHVRKQDIEGLSEFIAMGLTNTNLVEKLKSIEYKHINKETKASENLFDKVSNWLRENINIAFGIALKGGKTNQNLYQALLGVSHRLAKANTKAAQAHNRKLSILGAMTEALREKLNDKGRDYIQSFAKAYAKKFDITKLRIPENPSRLQTMIITSKAFLAALGDKETAKQARHLLDKLGVAQYGGITQSILDDIIASDDLHRQVSSLARASSRIDSYKLAHTSIMSKELASSFKQELDKETRQMLGVAILDTDFSSLLNRFDLKDMPRVISNIDSQIEQEAKELREKIASIPALASFKEDYFRYIDQQIEGLAYYMSTNKVKYKGQNLNAYSIAYMLGSSRKVEKLPKSLISKIDELVSLKAISKLSEKHKELLVNTIRDDLEGMTTLTNAIRYYDSEANEKLFKGNEWNKIKGYRAEITNPSADVKIVRTTEIDKMISEGYEVVSDILPKADTDRFSKDRVVMINKQNLVEPAWNRQAVRLTSMESKGTTLADIFINDSMNEEVDSEEYMKSLEVTKREHKAAADRMFEEYVKEAPDDNTLVPILDATGKFTQFRYVMNKSAKINLLDMDTDIFDSIATMDSIMFDKVKTKEHNEKVAQAIYEDFENNYKGTKKNDYIELSGLSDRENISEIYRVLPESFRARLHELFGDNPIMVRRDMLERYFGFRDVDMTNNRVYKQSRSRVFKQAYKLLSAIHLKLVKGTKAEIVIKTPATWISNIVSNLNQCLMQGCTPNEVIADHIEGVNALKEYREAYMELDRLKVAKRAGKKVNEVKYDNLVAKLNNSPVKPLISEGLFTAILEDLETNTSQDFIDRKYEEYMSKLPPTMRKGIDLLFVNKGTIANNIMTKVVQYSDFVSRYALYKKLTKTGMSHKEAINTVSDAFIDYDAPAGKWLKWGNDIGAVMFSKFFTRIQKVLRDDMITKRPADTLAFILGNYSSGIGLESTLEHSVLTKNYDVLFANPLSTMAEALSPVTLDLFKR